MRYIEFKKRGPIKIRPTKKGVERATFPHARAVFIDDHLKNEDHRAQDDHDSSVDYAEGKAREATAGVIGCTDAALIYGRKKLIQEKARASTSHYRAAPTWISRTIQAFKETTAHYTRAITDAWQRLIAALAAGGGMSVMIAVVVCMVGLIAFSPFGLFFANDNRAPGAVSVSTAVAKVNFGFNSRLTALQQGNYDDVQIHGQIADWPEVLSVFSVKLAGDETVPSDVVTLDSQRVAALSSVFSDMTAISTKVQVIRHPDSDPDDDIDDSWRERILHITISAKSANEMAEEYDFTGNQCSELNAMLDNRDELLALIGDLTYMDVNAEQIINRFPAYISAERQEVVKAACSLVGKVNYFWGGKSLVLGWDTRWGTTQKVWAAGSPTTGTYRPFGMDCSGFVDWVFYNATNGQYYPGHGGGAITQHRDCVAIAWSEAQPGDLVFYPGDEHIGIVAGRDDYGNLQIIHCSSGLNNVVITGVSGFTSIGRPIVFG